MPSGQPARPGWRRPRAAPGSRSRRRRAAPGRPSEATVSGGSVRAGRSSRVSWRPWSSSSRRRPGRRPPWSRWLPPTAAATRPTTTNTACGRPVRCEPSAVASAAPADQHDDQAGRRPAGQPAAAQPEGHRADSAAPRASSTAAVIGPPRRSAAWSAAGRPAEQPGQQLAPALLLGPACHPQPTADRLRADPELGRRVDALAPPPPGRRPPSPRACAGRAAPRAARPPPRPAARPPGPGADPTGDDADPGRHATCRLDRLPGGQVGRARGRPGRSRAAGRSTAPMPTPTHQPPRSRLHDGVDHRGRVARAGPAPRHRRSARTAGRRRAGVVAVSRGAVGAVELGSRRAPGRPRSGCASGPR